MLRFLQSPDRNIGLLNSFERHLFCARKDNETPFRYPHASEFSLPREGLMTTLHRQAVGTSGHDASGDCGDKRLAVRQEASLMDFLRAVCRHHRLVTTRMGTLCAAPFRFRNINWSLQ
jgi:hypothetical protein